MFDALQVSQSRSLQNLPRNVVVPFDDYLVAVLLAQLPILSKLSGDTEPIPLLSFG
jgi:hypothetical protein